MSPPQIRLCLLFSTLFCAPSYLFSSHLLSLSLLHFISVCVFFSCVSSSHFFSSWFVSPSCFFLFISSHLGLFIIILSLLSSSNLSFFPLFISCHISVSSHLVSLPLSLCLIILSVLLITFLLILVCVSSSCVSSSHLFSSHLVSPLLISSHLGLCLILSL